MTKLLKLCNDEEARETVVTRVLIATNRDQGKILVKIPGENTKGFTSRGDPKLEQNKSDIMPQD